MTMQPIPTQRWQSTARPLHTQDFAAVPVPSLPQLGSLSSKGL